MVQGSTLRDYCRSMSISWPSNQSIITNFAASDAYRAEVHTLIAGGAHTYSKGDDQFPLRAPAAMARGKHGRVWDVDGNCYVDCGLALGAVSLGHAYEPVVAAVREQLELGSAFQRPASIELELAREMLAAMPGMERIKFAKNGSNVTTAAVKLARAFNGRKLVAFPGDHAFYSFDDWFIGNTVMRSGVPDEFRALAVTYDSKDPSTLERLFAAHPGQISCVISEPENVIPIDLAIIRQVQDITKRHGAVFILDEMVTGFRAGFPGAYTAHGLSPDMTTWGKAIGNGFSFCALAGRADIMDLGGIKGTAPRVFLLSSTHGGEAHSLAAALAVLREYRDKDVIGRQHALVAQVHAAMNSILAEQQLGSHIEMHVTPWRIVQVYRDAAGKVSAPLRTLFLQEMIARGVLFQGVFLPCFTHTEEDIAQILAAFRAACGVYRQALQQGWRDLLAGEPTRPVFRKYNGCTMSCPADPCPHQATCSSAG
jgi:glutamate-1-semialdehyde 2,1-aminomutase